MRGNQGEFSVIFGFSYMCVVFSLRQLFLHWLPALCHHLLHCWLTTCPCPPVTYHLVLPQGKSLESNSMWYLQKKGIWWRQTALMMKSPLPRVFWWRLRSASLLPRSILVTVIWVNYCHVKLSHFNQGSVPEAVYVVRFHLWLTYWKCTVRTVANM